MTRRLGRLPVATERQEQQALIRWVALMTLRTPVLALLYAVPNGGLRDRRVAAMLLTEGVKPGVPDLHLPVARGIYHGLWIELKRRAGGRVSRAQQAWHDRLRAEGHRVVVAEGWEAARDAIMDYLASPTGGAAA